MTGSHTATRYDSIADIPCSGWYRAMPGPGHRLTFEPVTEHDAAAAAGTPQAADLMYISVEQTGELF